MEITQLKYDPERITQDFKKVLKHFRFHEEINQIGLLHRSKTTTNREHDLIRHLSSEQFDDLCFLDELKDTVFYQLYLDLKKICPLKVSRLRFMRMTPTSTYSFHHDSVPPRIRYHLVIKTNPQSFLMIDHKKWRPDNYSLKDCFLRPTPPEQNLEIESISTYHLPKDGRVYQFDPSFYHTAINGSNCEERIHLVASTV